jgi:hypothetical protein
VTGSAPSCTSSAWWTRYDCPLQTDPGRMEETRFYTSLHQRRPAARWKEVEGEVPEIIILTNMSATMVSLVSVMAVLFSFRNMRRMPSMLLSS